MRLDGLPEFFQRRGVLLFLTTAFFTTLVLGLFFNGRYQRYELLVRDLLVKEGRVAPRNPKIVMVAIDSASATLDELWDEELQESPALPLMKKGYPYPRAVYPYIIERIAQAGAKVIAFDIEFYRSAEGDPAFAAALEKYRDRVVFGINLLNEESDRGERRQLRLPPKELIPGDAMKDSRLGYVNFQPDEDLKVRHATYGTTILEWDKRPPISGMPELFSLAARIAQGAGYGDRLPKDHAEHLFRWSEEYDKVSLYQIFLKTFWERPPIDHGKLFKDNIVIIGPFGNWAKDELQTPLGSTPGPHVHVSALNAAITGDFLRDLSTREAVALILAGGVLAWLLGNFVPGAVTRLALILGCAAGYVALALFLYNTRGFYPYLLSPMLALLLSGGTWLGAERFFEAVERLRLRTTLEQFVSRDVVREMLDNKESYLNTLGGARKGIAVLMSDVRGFTTLTETAQPEQLVMQLREYFTAMVRIVFAQLGTLDKFIGDAVMASWGAFASRGPSADVARAISAALEMLRQLPTLNEKWKGRGWTEFRIGIGVTYGDAICGFIGSDEKREFTSIGDTVNLASRLEGATKEFHQNLLVGESAADLVRDQFSLRTVALIRVKGRAKPVECFTVLDLPLGSGKPAWLESYESAVQHFRDREFSAAEEDFRTAAELNPDDWLIGEYLRRTREYQASPPDAEWDAVFTMASK